MYDRKLSALKPGLFAFSFPHHGQVLSEIGLKLEPLIARFTELPNNALCYRAFLRLAMKTAPGNKGMQISGPFDGYEMRDEHIKQVAGRAIRLNDSFFRQDYNPLLIPCNSPAFRPAIDSLRSALVRAGFNIEQSGWDDYKDWEEQYAKSLGL